MINGNFKKDELVGRRCKFIRDAVNGSGQGCSAETTGTIIEVVRGRGFTVDVDPCPHCGQFARMMGVPRYELELINE